jgi:hypothetical protein
MEHDGPNGNTEQPGSVDENNSVDQQSGQNGTTNLPSDIQGQRLALSPFQFGVAGSEIFLNGEMLLAVPKSPNVKFSAEIENRLQGFECSQSLATEFAAEMTNRVHVQNLSPIVQAASFAADDFVGLTEHSPAQPDAQENLLAAQPSMHEAMQGTSIGGIDEAARPTTPCTVSTPVGVPEVLTHAHYDFDTNSNSQDVVLPPVSNIAYLNKIVADPIKGKPSLDEVINFGGILPNAEVGLRSSDRLRAQPNADATQLERAMMIAQQRNNLHTQGTTLDTHSSFYTFSDEDIISRAKILGISMGSNSKSERAAAQLIKETEKQRVLTFLKNDKTLEEEATLPPCIVVSRASDLCEDLDDFSDENLDEHIDLLISHSVAKQTRKKKSYDKTNVRRSDRLRIKRNNKKQF